MACSRSRVVLAIVAVTVVALATSVDAVVMTNSSTPPTVDGADIAWLGTPTSSDKWWPDPATTYGNPGKTVGQSFTTGSEDVLLNAFTHQVTSATQPTKTYTIRVGSVSGTTFDVFHTETATQSFATSLNDYWTWTFDTPVPLSANTLYGVDVGLTSSSSAWQTGIPYVHYNSDSATYPGGTRFRTGTVGYGVGDSSMGQTSGDRVFHLDMETTGGPPPPPPSHMISHYAFDGSTSDGGTLGNTAGALVGDAGFSAGKIGQALQLDGNGDYFDTNQDTPYDFIGGPLTYSFWAKLDGGWDESWECMIGKGENAAWRLARNSGSQNQVKYSTFLVANADLRDNEWHQFVATNANGVTQIFFDGALVATGGGTIGSNTSTSLWIGNNPQNAARAFGGWIDDVGIWDVVLSSEWAKAMYDLAMDEAFGYDAGQVNLLGLLHAQGSGTALIGLDLWEYAQRDPGDGRAFVPFAGDGTGVHFLAKVPEPATLSLLGLGALLALRRRRRLP